MNVHTQKVLLSLQSVKKTYQSGSVCTAALRGIDLDIISGEKLVILGKSGCGKSTLLNIIGGVDTLSEGSFLFEGQDYSVLTERQRTEYRRNKVGFVFQSHNLIPELTVLENVEFIANICSQPKDPEEVLSLVGMEEFKNKYPTQLSGGQSQRVSIARALVKKPTILLADEPTAALDYATSIEVLQVIDEAVEGGSTLVMVTHNEEIAKIADRIVRMKDGQISDIEINQRKKTSAELVW